MLSDFVIGIFEIPMKSRIAGSIVQARRRADASFLRHAGRQNGRISVSATIGQSAEDFDIENGLGYFAFRRAAVV
jgi:hypothetical protein